MKFYVLNELIWNHHQNLCWYEFHCVTVIKWKLLMIANHIKFSLKVINIVSERHQQLHFTLHQKFVIQSPKGKKKLFFTSKQKPTGKPIEIFHWWKQIATSVKNHQLKIHLVTYFIQFYCYVGLNPRINLPTRVTFIIFIFFFFLSCCHLKYSKKVNKHKKKYYCIQFDTCTSKLCSVLYGADLSAITLRQMA